MKYLSEKRDLNLIIIFDNRSVFKRFNRKTQMYDVRNISQK